LVLFGLLFTCHTLGSSQIPSLCAGWFLLRRRVAKLDSLCDVLCQRHDQVFPPLLLGGECGAGDAHADVKVDGS
jgi:hypothetical protein